MKTTGNCQIVEKEEKATEENKPTNLPYFRFKKMGKKTLFL